MATPKDIIISQLGMADYLFQQMTADLSDEEYFKPPVDGGNHAGWIVGHIAVSEDSMVGDLVGKGKKLPEATHELFQGGSTCQPGGASYPDRKEIEDMMRNVRANTLEALKMSDEAKWDEPSPEKWPKEIFPNVASIWGVIATHPFWHVGQLTVCRKAMGKKRVLG